MVARSHVFRAGAGVVAGVAVVVWLVVVPAVSGTDEWASPVDVTVASPDARRFTNADVSGGQVGVDARGNAIAVWREDNSHVRAAWRPVGGAWQPPQTIAVAPSFSGTSPQVAINAAGTAVAVWQRFDARTRGWIVQGAVRVARRKWQKPIDLSAGGSRRLSVGTERRRYAAASQEPLPKVAIDRRGNAVVVWEHYRRGQAVVQAAARSAGGAWQRPVDLDDSHVKWPHARPDVAVSPDGTVVAVWTDTVNRGSGPVVSATRRAGGTWTTPTRISTGRRALDPRVAIDARGNATVVWRKSLVVQSARRRAGGRWEPAVDVSTGRHAGATDAAVDAQGNAIAIWASSEHGGEIMSAVRPAGSRWQKPVEISDSAPPSDAAGADLAIGARGDVVVVWAEPDYGTDDDSPDLIVYAVVRPIGAGWTHPVKVNEPDGFPAQPRAAVDPHGNALVVWKGRMGILQAAARDARRR